MNGNYSIEIRVGNDKIIGELMTATTSDILKYLEKGFRVINKMTGCEMDQSSLTQTIGVSDGLINIG